MAATILDFNSSIHQKVRYHSQLYAILLRDFDFSKLPPNADVVIHFVSHDKIIFRDPKQGQEPYTAKKKELIVVEPHIIE